MTSAKNSLWILKERAEIERDMLRGNVNSRLLEGKKQDFVIARLSARTSLAFPVNQELQTCEMQLEQIPEWSNTGDQQWENSDQDEEGRLDGQGELLLKLQEEKHLKRNAQRREAYLREKIKLPEDLVLFWEEQEKALGAKGHQWHPKQVLYNENNFI